MLDKLVELIERIIDKGIIIKISSGTGEELTAKKDGVKPAIEVVSDVIEEKEPEPEKAKEEFADAVKADDYSVMDGGDAEDDDEDDDGDDGVPETMTPIKPTATTTTTTPAASTTNLLPTMPNTANKEEHPAKEEDKPKDKPKTEAKKKESTFVPPQRDGKFWSAEELAPQVGLSARHILKVVRKWKKKGIDIQTKNVKMNQSSHHTTVLIDIDKFLEIREREEKQSISGSFPGAKMKLTYVAKDRTPAASAN